MAVEVVSFAAGPGSNGASATVDLTSTPEPGDLLVVVETRPSGTLFSDLSGVGATWGHFSVPGDSRTRWWVGQGATSTGTITASGTGGDPWRRLSMWHIRGAHTSTKQVSMAFGPEASISQTLPAGGAAFVVAWGETTSPLKPEQGWTTQPWSNLGPISPQVAHQITTDGGTVVATSDSTLAGSSTTVAMVSWFTEEPSFPITRGDQEVTQVFLGNTPVTAVFSFGNLIWLNPDTSWTPPPGGA